MSKSSCPHRIRPTCEHTFGAIAVVPGHTATQRWSPIDASRTADNSSVRITTGTGATNQNWSRRS